MFAAPYGEGLFLCGKLLFDFAPGADFQAPAYPTEGLGTDDGGFISAYRTLDRFLQAIGRHRAFGGFQYIGGHHRVGLRLLLAFLHFTDSTISEIPTPNNP